MPDNLSTFDAFLWSAPDADLDALSLAGLGGFATTAGAPMPQISVATALTAHPDPFAVIAERGTGIVGHRATRWGGLLRGRLGDRDYVVLLWANEGLVLFVGAPPYTDTRWRRVEDSWIPAAAPYLSGLVLGRQAFEDVGRALHQLGVVGISRLSARVVSDGSSYTRGWPDSSQSLRGALDEAAKGMTLSTLSLSVGTKLSIHLRRNAGMTYYNGDWPLFCEEVIGRVTAAAQDRRGLLSGHDRADGAPLERTLVMKLAGSTLGREEVRAGLLSTVKGLRDMRVAVLHRNPYLHILVSDHLDGSSFDVFVTDDDALQVLPGHHATLGALGRVTDALAKTLGMQELLAEAASDEISEEDLLAAI